MNNDWTVQDRLNRKITDERDVAFKEIRKNWIHKLYQLVGSKQGKVNKLFPNKIGGFIQADKSYYFQFKNFFGKSDLLKVGDTVAFIVVASFDRKRQIETEEAMVITPFKSQNNFYSTTSDNFLLSEHKQITGGLTMSILDKNK